MNEGEGRVFFDRGQAFLVRCPECGRENYQMAVATGVCCWCGYDANPKPKAPEKKPSGDSE